MNNVVVGFTGTQGGMTDEQVCKVLELLKNLQHIKEVHHGDCIGADEEFHNLCTILRDGVKLVEEIHIHPPCISHKRANCALLACDTLHQEKPYLERNHDIVDAAGESPSGIVIATPRESKEQLRSGTWATIRYAKQEKVSLRVVLPDGSLRCYN